MIKEFKKEFKKYKAYLWTDCEKVSIYTTDQLGRFEKYLIHFPCSQEQFNALTEDKIEKYLLLK